MPDLIGSRLEKVLVFAVAMAVLLPIIANVSRSNYARSIDFFPCDGTLTPYFSPIYRTIYYVANDDVCQRLTDENERNRYKTAKISQRNQKG